MNDERYKLKAASDSTQVPDQVLLNNELSTGARLTAAIILMFQKGGHGPTRAELAATLKVDARTVDRWLDELRAELGEVG